MQREPVPAKRHALHLALNVFTAMLVVGVWYRIRLSALVMTQVPGSNGGSSPMSRSAGVFHNAVEEMLLALACAGLVLGLFGIARITARLLRGPAAPPISRGWRWAVLLPTLLLIGTLLVTISATMQTSVGVWRSMNVPLTYPLMLEGLVSGFVPALLHLAAALSVAELFFLFSPLWLLGLLSVLPQRVRRYQAAFVGSMALALTFFALLPNSMVARQPEGIRRTPVFFTARDAWRTLRRRVPAQLRPRPVKLAAKRGESGLVGLVGGASLSATQAGSVALTDSLFATSVKPQRSLPADHDKERWNVVILVMESTGLRYVYEQKRGKYPMPFLLGLAERGLSSRAHFSPANTSPRSIFSLISGLYPMPNYRIYAMRKGLAYPSLFSLAGKSYQSLLVTPGALTWYFPVHYLKRKGPQELLGYAKIKVKAAPKPARARDEEATVGFFLNKLRAMKARPFIGIYYSFVAHWPYPDFGKRFQRYPPTRKVYRYLNNLYLLDKQIERIFTTLEELGIAKRTIFVAVGDHGEAFGQHKNNWTHSRHSYNENYQTPLVFFQPRLFTPRVVTTPTSHVDILPTLLDAMNIRYNPKLLQGESLFQNVMRRKYVFLYGNEDTLSSVSQQGIKLQMAFKKRKCWVYNLKKDPNERRRLSCKRFRAQHRATVAYMRYQRKLLRDYNKAAAANGPFFGQKH